MARIKVSNLIVGEGNGNPLQYSCLENGQRKWKCFSCHGRRSLVGCSPWGHKESLMTEATKHSTLFLRGIIWHSVHLPIYPGTPVTSYMTTQYLSTGTKFHLLWYIIFFSLFKNSLQLFCLHVHWSSLQYSFIFLSPFHEFSLKNLILLLNLLISIRSVSLLKYLCLCFP